MFMLVVYDTDKRNCVKLYKQLKKYLHWNQRSVFEGTVTEAQYVEVKHLLLKNMVESSHIVIYSLETDKFLKKEELGQVKNNTSNVI